MLLLLFEFSSMRAQMIKGDFVFSTDLGSGIISQANSGLFGLYFGLNEGAGFNIGIVLE